MCIPKNWLKTFGKSRLSLGSIPFALSGMSLRMRSAILLSGPVKQMRHLKKKRISWLNQQNLNLNGMIQQIRILLIYFSLIAGISSCQGQTTDQLTEEQQLRKEMNDWMQPYRREKAADFEQWIDWVENHIDD